MRVEVPQDYDTRLVHIQGLAEALERLTVSLPLDERPDAYVAADAVLGSLQAEIERLLTAVYEASFAEFRASRQGVGAQRG